MKSGVRGSWVWVVVCVAVLGVAVLIYVATRSGSPVEPGASVEPVEVAVDPPAPEATRWVDEPAAATTFPAGVEWVTENAYGEKGKGLVSRKDADGDGLYDADEFLWYGTLRHDTRTRTSATRIDIRPRDATEVFVMTRTLDGMRFRELAKGTLKPEDDTDKDGLPDAWEMHWFKSLDYGPYDDPDGDGFPNIIEWYRGTDPTTPDILAPSMKPAELEDGVPAPKTSSSGDIISNRYLTGLPVRGMVWAWDESHEWYCLECRIISPSAGIVGNRRSSMRKITQRTWS
jgi:hypothetical protein